MSSKHHYRNFFALILILLTFSLSVTSTAQDSSGATPLHNASLVGHTRIQLAPDSTAVETQTLEPSASRLWPSPLEGQSCVDYNFEGGADLAPIPTFDGISFPGWLTLIDFDAGGTGAFANEPSPSTVGFWLAFDNQVDIVFDTPVNEVGFYYTSAVNVSLTAYDAASNVIQTVNGAENYNDGAGDPDGAFNVFTPLNIQIDDNRIKIVTLTGEPDFTGIDDLRVCKNIEIEAVEFTQAVQQYLSVENLQAELAGDGRPLIPIVAGKPMAVRVYIEELDTPEDVRVRVSGDIAERTSNLQSVQVNCSPQQQRVGNSLDPANVCRTIDLFVTPPEDEWSITVELLNSLDDVIDSETFTIVSVSTANLELAVSRICLRRSSASVTSFCSDPNQVAYLLNVLERVLPARRVTTHLTDTTLHLVCDDFDDNDDGDLVGDPNLQLWMSLLTDLQGVFTMDDWFQDLNDTRETRSYGLVPTAMNFNPITADDCYLEYAGLAGLNGDVATSLDMFTAFDNTQDLTAETLAHEAAHTLRANHTAGEAPYVSNTFPGCYSVSSSSEPALSPLVDEVGYDVWDSHNPIRPAFDVTKQKGYFDLMSYCSPIWVSLRTYLWMLFSLADDGELNLPARTSPPFYGQFWTVSGLLDAASVDFKPLFRIAAYGTNDTETGDYQLEVRGAGGTVLFTRAFTPAIAEPENSTDPDMSFFFELLPVQAGAVEIVLRDPSSAIIGTIPITGVAPTVDIVNNPTGTLSGQQTLSWTIIDPDSASHTAWVQYSPNGDTAGEWHNLITNRVGNTFSLNFNQLPGSSNNARIRVYVSDGSNTGSDMVGPFSVGFKQPTVEIQNPLNGAFLNGQGVVLVGSGYDVDENYLGDTALTWSSTIGGTLGTGRILALANLAQGVHSVTLTGRDSQNNPATDTVMFTVDRTQPVFSLDVDIDGIPTQCVDVTISASDALSGLDQVQFSLNGGLNWTTVAHGDLPYTFTMPGSGYYHVVARAADRAGNIASDDARIIIAENCGTATNGEVILTALLMGRPAPPSSLVSYPVRVRIYDARDNFLLFNQDITTSVNGRIILFAPPGDYIFWIKHAKSLAVSQEVTLLLGENPLTFTNIPVGDADNSNSVILTDFSLLAASFGLQQGNAGYDQRVDFNGDNQVNLIDFSLLAASFGRAGAPLP